MSKTKQDFYVWAGKDVKYKNQDSAECVALRRRRKERKVEL
jgi:hypothetical protein